MAFAPIWNGTWSSNINDEAYGIISVPISVNINSPTQIYNRSDVEIIFKGLVCKDKLVMGYTYVNSSINNSTTSNFFNGNIILDNRISIIDYKIVNLSGKYMEGYYKCYFPPDEGSFILTRSDITIGSMMNTDKTTSRDEITETTSSETIMVYDNSDDYDDDDDDYDDYDNNSDNSDDNITETYSEIYFNPIRSNRKKCIIL